MSSSLGSDDNPGTRAQPVRSMEQAIALAQAGAKRVYACAERFNEPVALPSGLEIWGGLDCTNDWVYLGGENRTILAPGSDLIPLRVDAGDGTSIVADVHAAAEDATVPGGSSVAAMVLAGAAVEILRSELSAGAGAMGAKGDDGGNGPAPTGTSGTSGGNACTTTVVPGGQEVETICGDLRSTGGQGGPGGIASGADGLSGQPVPVPNPQGLGLGGVGETSALQCTPGEKGANGTDGVNGLGGSGLGRLTSQGWRGQDGQDGGDGLPGQGGGGGGGGRGGPMLCGANLNRGGAGGGSGGAGGCGGRGGKGGGAGGASIGLLTLSGDVVVKETLITTARGGDGGTGGQLQPGGVGGTGGLGGDGFFAADPGCWGGNGGHGGSGGNGGGGLGGVSVGIAHLGGVPVTQEDVVIEIGEPGRGGLGGNPAIPGSAGEDGTAAAVMSFAQ